MVQKMSDATKLFSSALAVRGPLTELDGATILVVDDEPVNRAILRANLSSKHKILEAVDGPQALEVLANESVDRVLLDVVMPGISRTKWRCSASSPKSCARVKNPRSATISIRRCARRSR